MTEDLNTRLENAAKGITPQTCPDERRRYLGSLRERVLVRTRFKTGYLTDFIIVIESESNFLFA